MKLIDIVKLSNCLYKASKRKAILTSIMLVFLCALYLLIANAGILYSKSIKEIGLNYLYENPATINIASSYTNVLENGIKDVKKDSPKSIHSERYGITLYDFTYRYDELNILEGSILSSGDKGCLVPKSSGLRIGDQYEYLDFSFAVQGIYELKDDTDVGCIIDLLGNVNNAKLNVQSTTVTYDSNQLIHNYRHVYKFYKSIKAPTAAVASDSLIVFINSQKKSSLVLFIVFVLVMVLVMGTIGMVINEIDIILRENRHLFALYMMLGVQISDIIIGVILYLLGIVALSLGVATVIIAPVIAFSNFEKSILTLLPNEFIQLSSNLDMTNNFSWLSAMLVFVLLMCISIVYTLCIVRKKYLSENIVLMSKE